MIAVYDACVLHDPALRDLLIRLARKPGLDIQAKWSEQILDEMVGSIAERRPDLDRSGLERTRELMCEAIRDCLVTGHLSRVDELQLPDPNDRHVLAAAIHVSADVIVTFNLRDFPTHVLDQYGVEAEHPTNGCSTYSKSMLGQSSRRLSSSQQVSRSHLRRSRSCSTPSRVEGCRNSRGHSATWCHGTDRFLLAFSPERIDPGNPSFSFTDIPKIVGGANPDSTRAAEVLYSQVVPKVVAVPGTREAEMAKLVENTFRHVNIALVNELAVYAHDLGIDIWEAIGAAATKPFGFMPFWPGPGWGGHCIPLDPSYLSWRVRKDRAHEIRFVELAHMVNSEMPRYVVERITLLLNEQGKAVKGAKVMGIGVAYKGGTEDKRGSPGLKVLKALLDRGAGVCYIDPLVPETEIGDQVLRSCEPDRETLAAQDLVVVLTAQDEVPWGVIEAGSRLILDCCNAFGKVSDKILRL